MRVVAMALALVVGGGCGGYPPRSEAGWRGGEFERHRVAEAAGEAGSRAAALVIGSRP